MTEEPPVGHVKLARKAFDPAFGDEFWLEKREFSRWEAWVDVIQLACFSGYRHATRFGVVELQRGEFVASRRHLAKRWNWTEKKVRVWLATVQKGSRLRAQRETEAGTVYLIVNYDAYQSTPEAEGPAKGPRQGPARAQQGPKREAVKALTTLTTSPDSSEESVLAHYRAVHPSRRPGDKDRRAIRRALGTYTAPELCEAIDGNASDKWHREHKLHALAFVLKDNEKIDTFRARSVKTPAAALVVDGWMSDELERATRPPGLRAANG